ncbi:MAG: hypothetical protein ABI382_01855, partial [Nakamurella sp.]
PFHGLSQEHPGVVCGLNVHLIQGILDTTDQNDAHAELGFRPNRCCVTIQSAQLAQDENPDTRHAASRHAAPHHMAT